jgi:hypothetical protein
MARRLTAGIALALLVPGLALAAKPPSPGHGQPSPGTAQNGQGKPASRETYVLKGPLSNFSPAGATYGTVTITITHTNHQAKTLLNPQLPVALTIIVTWDTKIVIHRGATTITNGDRGAGKVRLPKNTPAASLVTTLTTLPTFAFQVTDQGPAPREPGIVISYQGEHQTRVVSLRKLRRSEAQ